MEGKLSRVPTSFSLKNKSFIGSNLWVIMTMFISSDEYIKDLQQFAIEIKIIHEYKKFDCIVAPKRSGLFVGTVLSHSLRNLPLFTPTEFKLQIKNIPFNNILVCDTAVYHGRTLRKIKSKLAPRKVFTAVIYKEGYGDVDYYLYNPRKCISFWYERIR